MFKKWSLFRFALFIAVILCLLGGVKNEAAVPLSIHSFSVFGRVSKPERQILTELWIKEIEADHGDIGDDEHFYNGVFMGCEII